MIWRIEVKRKDGLFDSFAEGIKKDIVEDLGITALERVTYAQVYTLEGDILEDDLQRIASELLTDCVTHQYTITQSGQSPEISSQKNLKIVEIAYHPGVMDPVEESTVKGIRDLGVLSITAVATSKKYWLYGNISEKHVATIVEKVLANKLIQHTVDFKKLPTTLAVGASAPSAVKLISVDLVNARSRQLMEISRKGQLYLNIDEMTTIQAYYQKLMRNPTDVELETIAQTWSEHCFHKTFRGNIRYTETVKGKKRTRLIQNLLKSTIARATYELNKSWCVSVFHDNAGVIKFDDQDHVCFKVETHNHPSALEPFGGANTGLGGVIRDILGTGLGAKPICSTDVFCFAPPDFPTEKLPAGTLHPKRVMKGVVSGVRDYGNKMGIPTVNGSVLFHPGFVGNPLVYCGNVGLLPKDKVKKEVHQGDCVVVLGGRTGRDGIHGATFSSGELTDDSQVVSSGAVQIGNPIQEKKVLDALLKARDLNLYRGITDCGAGGLSSAVGEMGKDTGARVYLDKVPLKYQGLSYTEIWISESQERMVLAVPPSTIEKFLAVCADENVEATVIGEFTNSHRLELFYRDVQVCDLSMEFLHDGNPRITKTAEWKSPRLKAEKLSKQKDLTETLHKALSHFNVCSKEWVVRQYDHEVQGGSVVKPFSGVTCDGPSDASVVRVKPDSSRGVVISNGINFRYGLIDPYWMSGACIDEAIRQVVCVGGKIDRIAILDNFCWGNPDKPDRLGSLVRCAQGCYDFAVAYGTPFISGKDSLYNEFAQGKKTIAIPGTLLISAIGIMDDITKATTMDFKKAGNLIYCVGLTDNELGGSIYLDGNNSLGQNVPRVNPINALKSFKALNAASNQRLIASMHDCSDGGLAVALAEMAFSGGLGVTVRLDQLARTKTVIRDDVALFSESNSRIVVEVDPKNRRRFEKLLDGVQFGLIGQVEASPEFVIYGLKQNICVNAYIHDLKHSWQKPLAW